MKSCKMQMLPRWKSSNYLRDATVIGRENVLGLNEAFAGWSAGLWHPRDKVLRYFWHSKFFWHHHWWSTSAALVDGDWSTTLDQKLLKISWIVLGCQYHHRISSRKVSFLEESCINISISSSPHGPFLAKG